MKVEIVYRYTCVNCGHYFYTRNKIKDVSCGKCADGKSVKYEYSTDCGKAIDVKV